MTRILMFGTFDIIHPGHLLIFKQAKSLGDELYVVIALDSTVRKVKGKDPLNNQEQRRKNVQRVTWVDKAVLGHEEDKYRVLEEIRPDIIALGYDQSAFVQSLNEEITKRGLKIRIVRLGSHRPEVYKSSKVRQRFNL
jgi:FAD synthetase